MKGVTHIISDIISYKRPDFSTNNLQLLYSCIDLTNLNSYATNDQIETLCKNALRDEYNGVGILNVAAVCVYPVYVKKCAELLKESGIEIASVTAAFPHAQTFSDVKYLETELAISNGATEIDIVINLSAFLNKNESLVFDEIKAIKQLCGAHHLKVILETDLLKEKSLIEQASFMSLEAGADFIKTSTGKDGSKASLEAVYIMSEVIKSHFEKTGYRAGLKPAGGISTSEEALNYLAIIHEVLGADWMNNKLFRLGASRLAGNLLDDIISLQ